MPDKERTGAAPKVQKLGGRRVKTEPKPGTTGEPPHRGEADSGANDERLRAEKPPHY